MAFQRAVEAGVEVISHPTLMFWGDLHAGVRDMFGNQWWIAQHSEDMNKERMEQGAREYFAKRAKYNPKEELDNDESESEDEE